MTGTCYLLFLVEKIQNGLELQIRCFENPRFIVLIKIFKIQIYQKILSTVNFKLNPKIVAGGGGEDRESNEAKTQPLDFHISSYKLCKNSKNVVFQMKLTSHGVIVAGGIMMALLAKFCIF